MKESEALAERSKLKHGQCDHGQIEQSKKNVSHRRQNV